VAVIGATDRERSVGGTVLKNLLTGTYKGRVYPVNPRRSEILGMTCYPSIGKVPEAAELVVVVTPAETVPGIVRECVKARAKAMVVISAGFKEKGAEGQALERQIQAELRKSDARLIGPNCLGLMNPLIGLNATFAQDIARPGNVAFLSQSGALLTAILTGVSESMLDSARLFRRARCWMLAGATCLLFLAMTKIPRACSFTWNRLAMRAALCPRRAKFRSANRSS
jgi:acetyltransferase